MAHSGTKVEGLLKQGSNSKNKGPKGAQEVE